jgi:hypothetical protein
MLVGVVSFSGHSERHTMHAHLMTDPAAIARFVLGGNATFTLKNTVTGNRFTYKVTQIRKDGRAASPHFVKLMTGPDNESSFEYVGLIKNEANYFHGGAKAKVPADARAHKTFEWFWNTLQGRNARGPLSNFPGFEFWHEGRCCRCGRKLTVPESIANGIGPECAKH